MDVRLTRIEEEIKSIKEMEENNEKIHEQIDEFSKSLHGMLNPTCQINEKTNDKTTTVQKQIPPEPILETIEIKEEPPKPETLKKKSWLSRIFNVD